MNKRETYTAIINKEETQKTGFQLRDGNSSIVIGENSTFVEATKQASDYCQKHKYGVVITDLTGQTLVAVVSRRK